MFYFLLLALMMPGLSTSVSAQGTDAAESPTLLTNLFQLRHNAEQKPLVRHPFQITAEVLDANTAGSGLLLRDSSGDEFVRLDLRGQTVEPGATLLLEGRECGAALKDFGLTLLPGLVVGNNGLHAMVTESGTVFLHAGANPILLQWFNRTAGFGLHVEYQGPGLSRQQIPTSVLSRTNGSTATLNYRCYEGTWQFVPDFQLLHPVKSGVATNFDLGVRTRNEAVGLEFNGLITVPRDGPYTFHLTSDDGSRLFVGESSLEVRVLGEGVPAAPLEGIPAIAGERKSHPWVTITGKVVFAGEKSSGGEMVVRAGKDDIRVAILEGRTLQPGIPLGSRVRVSGIYEDVVTDDGSPGTGMLLALSWNSVRPAASSKNGIQVSNVEESLQSKSAEEPTGPAIATIASVKELSPGIANQKLSVSVRGVVTAVLPSYLQGAVIQDSTKGIYISLAGTAEAGTLKSGEFCQVDGVTGSGLFAPIIVANRLTHLGPGRFPIPVHASRYQLVNGTLDTQYTEMEGIVTAAHGQQITILNDGGKITLDLNDFQPEDLAGCQNAFVRIRGCAFANFNQQTRELDARSLRIMGGAIDIVRAPPTDLFDAPERSIGELRLYDPRAGTFQRLKVRGQVIYGRGSEYYLTDGSNGLIVTANHPEPLDVGDLVEVVGFLELGGPAPELKEALLRRTGNGPLPAPVKLTADQLLAGRHSGTLVRVQAVLMNHWLDGADQVLEFQSGFVAFEARVSTRGATLPLPPAGSQLDLTGIYAPQGVGEGNGTVSGFQLLLNSPSDIRIVSTPPWWTLQRVLILSGILAALLFGVLIWNTELHRKVQERSHQLETEIQTRRQAELKQAAELERARIARDLHDELGTGLTEVSLLANAGAGEFRGPEKNSDRFRVIADKASALVSGLDVIVWAIDPKRNSVQSFADYVGRYATELFSASGIICRFKIPIECGAVALVEQARHSLFLAVKEALNNVIRHSSATEVKLQITQTDGLLEIVIADNGRGFVPADCRLGNGLTNLRERIEALDGQCHIDTQLGKGTTIKFTIPLRRDLVEPSMNKTSEII